MTSEAPERIWARPDYNECWPERGEEEDVEYIRADHALALVAEAYEDIAENYFGKTSWGAAKVDIASRTPADALAAREARDKQVREEALREAADLAGSTYGDLSVDPEAEILALIEGDTDER